VAAAPANNQPRPAGVSLRRIVQSLKLSTGTAAIKARCASVGSGSNSDWAQRRVVSSKPMVKAGNNTPATKLGPPVKVSGGECRPANGGASIPRSLRILRSQMLAANSGRGMAQLWRIISARSAGVNAESADLLAQPCLTRWSRVARRECATWGQKKAPQSGAYS
jgi:hypothetical protein